MREAVKFAIRDHQKVALTTYCLGSALLITSITLVLTLYNSPQWATGSAPIGNTGFTISQNSRPNVLSCELSLPQVNAANCVFDEMMNGWVPQPCYNTHLAQDALQDNTMLARLGGAGHFPWYQDLNFKFPIPSTNLSEYLQTNTGNMTAYTWEKWHVAHCLYIWRLGRDVLSRVAEGQRDVYVNSRVFDPGHVAHCNEIIANQNHRIGAKSVVSFGRNTCIKVV